MKATLLVPVFFLLSFFVHAQNADSLSAVKQVDSLIQVSRALTEKRDFDKALEINAAAEKLVLEALGRESAPYVECCLSKGETYQQMGELSEAEKSYLEAKSIHERSLGKENFGYVNCLSTLGVFYAETGGAFEKTEPFFTESVAIVQKKYGKAHPEYAGKLINLALVYMNYGKYGMSERLFNEAKSILETNVMAKYPETYMNCIFNFANLYGYMGDYEKCILTMLEAKAMIEKLYGKDHYLYANLLNNLGATYCEISDFKTAEPLFFEAKDAYEKTLGKEHPKYSETIGNLATVYLENGNYEKAELFYEQAIAIAEKTSGKESHLYALNIGGLGNYYLDKRVFDKSEPLLLETIGIFERTLGREHPECAYYIRNLAILLIDKGEYERAEALLLESVANIEKTHGKKHLLYAESANELANGYMIASRYEQAEQLYLEAKAIIESMLGKDNSKYANILGNLSKLYWKMGRISSAALLLQEMAEVHRSLLVKASKYLSENEMRSYVLTFETALDQNLSFAQIVAPSGFSGSSFDNSLFHKGFLLQSSNQVKNRGSVDSTGTELLAQLRSCHRRLAAVYILPFAERDSVYVVDLAEKANSLEKEITRNVAGYGEAFQQVKWQELQSSLKPAEAAIEFVRYKFSNPEPSDSIVYAAHLLKQGYAQPQFIPLFEEKSLDSLLQRNSDRKEQYVKQLYSLADRGIIATEMPQKSLYNLLWHPLERQLSDINTIYYSPSGLLHRINLAAIPLNIDSVLGDRYKLVELGSTRQVVIPTQIIPAANDALLFGGIRYEADTTVIRSSNTRPDSFSIVSRGGLSFSYSDSTLRSGQWNYLPFTEKEVNSVEKMLKKGGISTQTNVAYNATEESFKTIGASGNPSPRILHIATHGFFFPDPQTSEGFKTLPTLNEPIFKISDHPMIRSGLLLAGANHAWKTGKPLKPGMEDGILTAYEISQMNLSNTERVVLSACETGLGDIQGNEGVYGLQRAFKIAGVKYLIMSLWQVPDKQTSLLMTTFYKKWLEEKMTIPEAFRAAQKELRDAGLDPYQWAGFVLVE
ncbi:MAG: CHAT domain-containing protein [Saprospiraceae bacterium]